MLDGMNREGGKKKENQRGKRGQGCERWGGGEGEGGVLILLSVR